MTPAGLRSAASASRSPVSTTGSNTPVPLPGPFPPPGLDLRRVPSRRDLPAAAPPEARSPDGGEIGRVTTLVAGRAQAELDRHLENGVAELGLSLGRDQRSTLLQYLALLEKWNQVYNLTAIRDREKVINGHLLDCLAVIPFMSGARCLVVGIGVGFPGIPVAVARPDIQVVLLDSNHKKAAFLRQAVADLQLKNASVICERVDAWQAPEKFHCIVSPAFAENAEFIAPTGHLPSPGGV